MRTVNTILMNPKLAKVSLMIVDRVLECINMGVFGPAVIDLVVKGLVNIAPELDVDTAHHERQFQKVVDDGCGTHQGLYLPELWGLSALQSDMAE